MHREVATSAQCVYSRIVIPQEPLPEGWTPDRDLSDDEGDALDRILFSEEQRNPAAPRARWSLIRNAQTGEKAWLRLFEQGEAGVTALVFTPRSIDSRIINRSVRSIPLAAIELSLQEQSQRRRRQLDHRLFDKDWDPDEPVGNPRETNHFYERVALQFLSLKENGEARPVARMAEINQRPLKTVQGWVTDTRKKGLLPPGKRGRAG